MTLKLNMVTFLVRDYDEAIYFFTKGLNFLLTEDTKLDDTKRWVVVSSPDHTNASILLAKASTPEQQTAVGNQAGGRVFLFLHTNDFWTDYSRMQAFGIHFTETPRQEEYGLVVVFEDLYGNKWDLIEPAKKG